MSGQTVGTALEMTQSKPSKRPLRFAIVIPLYNHASRVRGVVEGALSARLPVIVVDDGSSDNPTDALDALDIILIRHERNQGKGRAITSGLKEAAKIADYAITIDADGQHDTADIPALIHAAKANPGAVVLGSRRGMKAEGAPLSSRFGRGFSNFWVYITGGGRHADTQSGFRAYPIGATLALQAKAMRYQFEVEILVLANRARIPIVETDIKAIYQSQGERLSHFHPWQDFWRNTKTFTRLFFQRLFRLFSKTRNEKMERR